MFLIFGSESYYANGGARDIIMTINEDIKDINQLIELAEGYIGKRVIYEYSDWSDDRGDDAGYEIEWVHIYDVLAQKIIYHSIKNHLVHKKF